MCKGGGRVPVGWGCVRDVCSEDAIVEIKVGWGGKRHRGSLLEGEKGLRKDIGRNSAFMAKGSETVELQEKGFGGSRKQEELDGRQTKILLNDTAWVRKANKFTNVEDKAPIKGTAGSLGLRVTMSMQRRVAGFDPCKRRGTKGGI